MAHNTSILPAEIVDTIFTLLQPPNLELPEPSVDGRPDIEDLRACYAVCSMWRNIAERYVFRDFTVTFYSEDPYFPLTGRNTHRGFGLNKPLPKQDPCVWHTLPALLRFLHDSPFIAHSVRRLRLYGIPRDNWKDSDMSLKLLQTEPAVLLGILRALPNLKVVHLCNVVLTAPVNIGEGLMSPLDQVRVSYARLKQPWEVPDLEVTQVLSCFTEVKELHLFGAGTSADRADREDYTGPSQLKLQSLIIQRKRNKGVLFKHLMNSAIGDARSLTLGMIALIEDAEIERFQAFLRTIGPQLRRFRIMLQNEHFRAGDQVVDISHCHNIEELTIGLTIPIFSPLQCVRVIEDLISTLSLARLSWERFPSLESVALEITFDAKTFCNVSDPDEDWIPQCPQLEVLDSRLVSVAKECASESMKGIYLECVSLGEVNARGSVARMLPELHRRKYARFREPRTHAG